MTKSRGIPGGLTLILGEGQIADEGNCQQTGYREQQNDDNHGSKGLAYH
jgi:hypothetical protein